LVGWIYAYIALELTIILISGLMFYLVRWIINWFQEFFSKDNIISFKNFCFSLESTVIQNNDNLLYYFCNVRELCDNV
jgi:hypothetical protein